MVKRIGDNGADHDDDPKVQIGNWKTFVGDQAPLVYRILHEAYQLDRRSLLTGMKLVLRDVHRMKESGDEDLTREYQRVAVLLGGVTMLRFSIEDSRHLDCDHGRDELTEEWENLLTLEMIQRFQRHHGEGRER